MPEPIFFFSHSQGIVETTDKSFPIGEWDHSERFYQRQLKSGELSGGNYEKYNATMKKKQCYFMQNMMSFTKQGDIHEPTGRNSQDQIGSNFQWERVYPRANDYDS